MILGDDQASGAFDRFARSVDKANRSADKNTESLKKQEAQSGRLSKTVDSLGTSMSGLGSPLGAAIAGGVALAPIAVTLGAGLGGLGLAALSASKHTQAMGVILGPLKQEVRDFQNSLQPQVFTLFGDGAGIARDVLKELQPVAAATGNALHGVLGQVGAEFRSGEWKQFFQFMEQQAGPDLQLVGTLFVDLARDVPPLLEQLQPLGRVVLILADVVLKAVGGLEKMHLVLPIVGAAAGLLLGGGPIGALIGAFAGLAIQEYSAARATKQVATEFEAVAQVTMPSSAAVSVDWAAVAGSLGKTAVSAADVANAMIDLHPKLGTIRGDMDLLNATVGSGNVVVAAYSDLWNQFVGKSVSYQQAVLNLKQAFEGYNSAVKSSGRTSTAAQQSFLSIFTTMESGLQTLQALQQQQRASIGQVNDFYQTSIARLNALHGLTPAQRADVQGLTRDYLAWASTVDGLDRSLVTAAGSIRDTLLAQLSMSHRLIPQASSDATALANAILKTGDNSRATAIDRQQLIKDFEKSGLTAIQAKQAAIQFQDQIDKLHGKSVNVDLTTSGHGTIVITGTGINQRTINTSTGTLRGPGGHTVAAGWLLSGGVPGKDSIPLLGMPGELMVPKHLVDAGTVDHLRGRIPGFAAGGVVGKVSGAEGGIGTAEAQWGQLAAQAFAVAADQAAIKAAAAAAAASFTGGPAATGSAAAAQAFARSILPGGWSWPALLSLWNQESGWNAWAVNPSSGAYGIPQSLGHGHPYNLGDYANQVRWGISYIAGRYGSSQGAWAHEQAFNWYGGGLDAVFGKPTIIGVGERGKEHVTVTPAGKEKEPSFATLHQWLLEKQHGKRLAGGQLHWLHVAHLQHLAHLSALGGRGSISAIASPPSLSSGGSVTGVPGPRGGDGASVYNITVNVAPGTHPAQAGKAVVEAIREYERLSGKGWRAP